MSDLSSIMINQVNPVNLHIEAMNATSFTQTNLSNTQLFQLPLTAPPFVDSIMSFSNSGPSTWIAGGGSGGLVSLTGANGVLTTPNPITSTGTIGLVANLIDNGSSLGLGLNNFNIAPIASTSVAIGNNALQNSTQPANANCALGTACLQNNTTGQQNCAMGYGALNHLTTNNYNVAYGTNAGGLLTSGDANVFIGTTAGGSQTSYAGGCTCVGYQADCGVNALTNASAIGNGAKVNVSNALVLGGPGVHVGIGSANSPANTLCFIGNMQQGSVGGSINPSNTIKGQVSGSLLTVSPGSQTVFSYPINIGTASTQASNFFKVDILFGSNIGGNTPNSSFASAEIMVTYQVLGAIYALIGTTAISFTNEDNIVNTATWALSGSNLNINMEWNDGGQTVAYIISYETFSAQN